MDTHPSGHLFFGFMVNLPDLLRLKGMNAALVTVCSVPFEQSIGAAVCSDRKCAEPVN